MSLSDEKKEEKTVKMQKNVFTFVL